MNNVASVLEALNFIFHFAQYLARQLIISWIPSNWVKMTTTTNLFLFFKYYNRAASGLNLVKAIKPIIFLTKLYASKFFSFFKLGVSNESISPN